jgi:hypothetical protein
MEDLQELTAADVKYMRLAIRRLVRLITAELELANAAAARLGCVAASEAVEIAWDRAIAAMDSIQQPPQDAKGETK